MNANNAVLCVLSCGPVSRDRERTAKQMFVRSPECQVCGARVDDRARDWVADSTGPDRRVWHFGCLPEEEVAAGEIAILADHLSRYNVWRIQALKEENTFLRERTDALFREVVRLMQATGSTEQDVEDFAAEFRFRER